MIMSDFINDFQCFILNITSLKCYFLGCKPTIGKWKESPNTVHNWTRNKDCKWCGSHTWENGYFSELPQDKEANISGKEGV